MHTDPIELEIFKNLFVAIAEEMGVTLCRTGFSPNIKERLDYSCALYDAAGQTIAQGDHLPVHLGAMPLSVQAAIAHVDMAPGDIVILNDPYRGGTHLPDITLVSPIFLPAEEGRDDSTDTDHDEMRAPLMRSPAAHEWAPATNPADAPASRPAFFVANRAHHSDVGGMSPGSMPLAREIYQEGLILPPIRLVRAGVLDRDLLSLILANVRTPDEREGDLTAQIAANRVGAARLLAMVTRYGHATIAHYAAETQNYAERVLRAHLARIPDGVYTFSDHLDNDGFTDEPILITCTITIAGGSNADQARATVDFTGSAPQTSGGVNANLAITLSATLYCFRCLLTEDVLTNAGIARPITVIAPEGTVVNARRPSAVAGGNVETSQRITDVVFGALAKALPGRIPAASQGTMNNVTLGGTHPLTGAPFAYYETAAGGMGGRPDPLRQSGLAGLSGVHTHMSNTRNTPVEALEQALPLRIRRYALRQDSAGAGKYPGGQGLIREYEALAQTQVTLLTERRLSAPYGAQGGQPGGVGRNTLIHPDGTETALPAKTRLELAPGDLLRIETPGGGGFGAA